MIASIIALVGLIFLLSSAIEEYQKDVYEQQLSEAQSAADASRASVVEELIDGIGIVTLDSGSILNRVSVNYNALTNKQKALVSNYSVYLAAQKRYDELKAEYLLNQTKDDPTRNITLADLSGDWESDTLIIRIGDLGDGPVWFNTFNKKTEIWHNVGVISTEGTTTLEEYDPEKKVKSGKLFKATVTGGYYQSFTVKCDSNGAFYLTVDGTTYKKIVE